MDVAKCLSIVMPEDESNSFGFRTSKKCNDLGYNQNFATKEINSILKKYNTHIFRLVDLNKVPYEQYDYLIEDLLFNKMIVGIGYNYEKIKNLNSESVSKHISFIDNIKDDYFTLLDYYIQESGVKFIVSYENLIRASKDVNGGLWIIGDPIKIENIFKQYGIHYDKN